MSLQITVLPASTNAGKATIRTLLSQDSVKSVQGIYRDVSKAPSEFTENPKFTASVGDVSNGKGLDFTGSDAVLYIPPPPQDAASLDDHATRAATHVKEALSKAFVKRLALISSMGAQFDREIVSSIAHPQMWPSRANPGPGYPETQPPVRRSLDESCT